MAIIGHACIYKLKRTNRFLIHSLSKIQIGGSIASPPYIWLDGNSSKEDIVSSLLKALDASKTNMPNPKNWDSFFNEFLQIIGLKKQSELYKGCININVVRKNGLICFTPMGKDGNGGFINVPNAEVEIDVLKGIEQISLAFEVALDRSY